jgi:hypothetical protein
MSFGAIVTLLPAIVQGIDAVDDLVFNLIDRMSDEPDLDPSDAKQLALMMEQKKASAARRDAALDRLKAKIEAKRAQN